MIARSELHWLEEASLFFEKKGPVWDTLRKLVRRLDEARIDYVIIGGIALNAHNYPRQTVDIDLVMTDDGFEEFRRVFSGSSYRQAEGRRNRFVDAESKVNIDVLLAGGIAGQRSKNSTVRFPDPSHAEFHDNMRTVSIAKLIELKLVTWRFKDWGDVVELIRRNNLPAAFAEQLDSTVRSAFGECHDQANDEEYEEPTA